MRTFGLRSGYPDMEDFGYNHGRNAIGTERAKPEDYAKSQLAQNRQLD